MPSSDTMDMKGVLDSFYRQCRDALHLGSQITVAPPIRAIVVVGMGGSAVPGDILSCYLKMELPVFVCRDYTLPEWVTKNTLVFGISYSGNTEETLEAVKDAKRRGCKIVVLTSGGRLRELAKMDKLPLVELPQGISPRAATGYMTIPILRILEQSGIIRVTDEFEKVIDALKKDHAAQGDAIAKKLVGKIPIIYTSHDVACISRVWKLMINENAKVQAFANEFPELNHNEMVGFTSPKGDFYFILIEDRDDHPRVKTRISMTKKLLEAKGYPVLFIRLTGESKLARIFSAMLLGSYVGYYLALAYGTDPTPVKMVEEFKEMMKR